jgi:hypothetical protein
MVTGPFAIECEKSPARSSADGTVATALKGELLRVVVQLKKKNVLSLLISFGILRGPPRVAPKRG